MRKIALRGLIGRKGDTILLWSVVTLAFLFLVLSTTLITSLEATDAAQRLRTYGTWQVMGAGLNEQSAGDLAARAEKSAVLPMIPVNYPGVVSSEADFYVSTYSPDLVDLGQLTLREGHWPESRNEIVLDYAQMSAAELSVGDEITLVYIQQLPATEEYILEKQQMVSDFYFEKIGQYRDDIIHFQRSGFVTETEEGLWFSNWEWFISKNDYKWFTNTDIRAGFYMYWAENYEFFSYLFADEEHPDGRAIPVNELTEEDIDIAYDVYEARLMDTSAYAYYTHRTADLIGLEDLVINTAYTDNTPESNLLTVKMQYTFTVSGVVETFSDRWDSGQVTLPRGFVSNDYYELTCEGKKTVLEKTPMFEDIPTEHLVLLSGGEETSAYDLWQNILPTYNAALLGMNDFTAPVLERRGYMKINDEGILSWVDNATEQLVFRFSVADPDNMTTENRHEISAWLVADGWNEKLWAYLYDEAIGDDCGPLFTSFTGSLSDLVETDEDQFRLREARSDGKLSTTPLTGDLLHAVVRFDYNGERYEMPLRRFISGEFTVEGMKPVAAKAICLDTAETPSDYDFFRVNKFAYPPAGESTDQLLMLVIGILFVTTVCAVFQIFFSQIRRRLRRIVLLKSVGAVDGQITGMMLWEFLFFLVTSLPVGTLLGLVCAKYGTGALGRMQDRTVLLTIDRDLLIIALAVGIIALFIGMLIPMVMAVGVPLTGRTVRKKALRAPTKEKPQNFFNITVRNLFVNRKRTVGNFALSVFVMLIGVLCLFLGFRMMGEYRDTVVRDDMPEYRLRMPCAMSLRQRNEYLAALEELGVADSVTAYLVGEDITIMQESFRESPLLTIAANDLSGISSGYDADFRALSSSDPLFTQLNAAATVGTLDPEAFDAGEEVLLLIPLYRVGGEANESELSRAKGWDRIAASGISTSYYAEYDGIYSRDDSISVGDTLSLHTTTARVVETVYETSENFGEITVGAILYYFPDTGIWPFAGDSEGYQIICSPSIIRMMLPDSVMSRTREAIRAIAKGNNVFYTNEYGFTDFYINGRGDLSTEEVDTALLVFARSNGMEIEVYHESSEKLLRDAVNNILLVCLLGLTAVLLSLVIFGNTVSSEIEQERNRIGILQSLGVSNKRFALRQFCIGLVFSLLAVLIANILLWTGIGIYALAGGHVLGNLLWGYPLHLHAALCAAIAAIIILLYVNPIRRLRKYLPIENIKTGK